MGICFVFEVHVFQFLSEHELCGDTGHLHACYLGDKGHGPACPRVCFEDIDLVVGNGVLDVHKPDDLQFLGQFLREFVDRINMLFRECPWRYGAGAVAGMDTGKFDMFHDRRNKGIFSVGDGISLYFDGVFEEFVDQYGASRCNIDSRVDIGGEHDRHRRRLPCPCRRAHTRAVP